MIRTLSQNQNSMCKRTLIKVGRNVIMEKIPPYIICKVTLVYKMLLQKVPNF